MFNLNYTDGNDWSLYRNGARIGKMVRLSGPDCCPCRGKRTEQSELRHVGGLWHCEPESAPGLRFVTPTALYHAGHRGKADLQHQHPVDVDAGCDRLLRAGVGSRGRQVGAVRGFLRRGGDGPLRRLARPSQT